MVFFFWKTADEYRSLFEKQGFKFVFSKIEMITTKHTPEEVFKIFSPGAMAGYLNQDYYDVEITDEYISVFKEIVREAFKQQSERFW